MLNSTLITLSLIKQNKQIHYVVHLTGENRIWCKHFSSLYSFEVDVLPFCFYIAQRGWRRRGAASLTQKASARLHKFCFANGRKVMQTRVQKYLLHAPNELRSSLNIYSAGCLRIYALAQPKLRSFHLCKIRNESSSLCAPLSWTDARWLQNFVSVVFVCENYVWLVKDDSMPEIYIYLKIL